MNHLRQILDLLRHRPEKIDCDENINQATASNLAATVDRFGESAMCFVFGETSVIDMFAPVDALCRLPYRCCWFEFECVGDDNRIALAGVLLLDEQIRRGITFVRHPGMPWMLAGCFDADEHWKPTHVVPVAGELRAINAASAYLVRSALSVMNCRNVESVLHEPEQRLQRARAKRGKQPLFSYWTLQLGVVKGGNAACHGGTHSSPRAHLRRGHPREYEPGKWTWVQPHAVGNKAFGLVHKDYDGSRLAP